MRDLFKRLASWLLVAASLSPLAGFAIEHPGLLLTRDGVESIRANLGKAPLFDDSLRSAREDVDQEIALGIDVPVPQDFSGGYTHERHKRNFFVAQKAALLYQILDEPRYGNYVRDMLLEYAALYPTLPLHPKERSYARGRLFWQCLNDANWLLYMAQAYDAVYEFLSVEDRELLERDLFRPFADFISLDNPQFYNRVHNHSAWGSAAVGMIGVVMGDEVLIDRALYGFEASVDVNARDNDGGLISTDGQGRGFLANLDAPFSPDGYYTEGPYYQRYAMYPFLAFSIAMENAYPDKLVLQQKDTVLVKATYALLNLADSQGEFFPINDAQKGMSIINSSLVTAVDAAYLYGEQDPALLSVASEQGQVALDQSGMAVALAIEEGHAKPFLKRSVILRDGPRGEQGGIAVLRDPDAGLETVFKFSAHGLSHGHFDKLAIAVHDAGREVLQDYGLVRFVNIEQKGGGNYLPENKSWAKQTVAANTLVVDGQTQFGGEYDASSRNHSDLLFSDIGDDSFQIVSAREENAYAGSVMQRTVAMLRSPQENPVVLDVLRVTSDSPRTYDLPFHYLGQVIHTNFSFTQDNELRVLGDGHGYEHLWREAVGEDIGTSATFTWLDVGRFNTITTATQNDDRLFLARLGANDPDFNLRRDPTLIVHRESDGPTVFASTIQSHGGYDPVSESAVDVPGDVDRVEVLLSTQAYEAVGIHWHGGERSLLIVAHREVSAGQNHKLGIGGREYHWTGPFHWVPLL
ncbi:heparinase II/III family protein [Congregibacter brevis]|uniref:Heparinase II/III family protein n=1 Tax=Congregibacter brevis TaxID=3081201 RepID=A0ABZ0IG55_9GAMM|nr:heparinase II/III family protein [Congregibacter sp. IMCC45268]